MSSLHNDSCSRSELTFRAIAVLGVLISVHPARNANECCRETGVRLEQGS